MLRHRDLTDRKVRPATFMNMGANLRNAVENFWSEYWALLCTRLYSVGALPNIEKIRKQTEHISGEIRLALFYLFVFEVLFRTASKWKCTTHISRKPCAKSFGMVIVHDGTVSTVQLHLLQEDR